MKAFRTKPSTPHPAPRPVTPIVLHTEELAGVRGGVDPAATGAAASFNAFNHGG